MKKSILNIGKALSKAEQQTINGGGRPCAETCYWQSWFAGDFCRTADCQQGLCSGSGICELIEI